LNTFTDYLSINDDEAVNDVWKQIVSEFCSTKLTLFTNEYKMSPIYRHPFSDNENDTQNMSSDESSYGASSQTPPHQPVYSLFSDSVGSIGSTQPLSPSTHPSPKQDINDYLQNLLQGISVSIFTDDVSVFDDVNFDAYIVYFTSILAQDVPPNTVVILKENPQGIIQDSILKIQQGVGAPASSGGKANKKKSTKRRTPRHRQHKRSQYSKKKRNTSSKRKKRLSIKHKKSQPKYHDTRKRRK